MGLKVLLKSERGEVLDSVADPANMLHRLLPSQDDHASICLRFIDWYGDTVFNRLQMSVFLDEWKNVEKKAITEAEKKLASDVKALATRCQKGPHLYLMFYGD